MQLFTQADHRRVAAGEFKVTFRQAMVRAERLGPWSKIALDLVERHPRIVARVLADDAGIVTADFKVFVRKLKKLGLTTTHVRGYELTERGQAVLDELRAKAQPRGQK